MQDGTIWKEALSRSGGYYGKACEFYIDLCLNKFSDYDYAKIGKIKGNNNHDDYADVKEAILAVVIVIAVIGSLAYINTPKKYEAAVEIPAAESVASAPDLGSSQNNTSPSTGQLAPNSQQALAELTIPTAGPQYADVNSDQTESVAGLPKFAQYPATDYYHGPVAPTQIGPKGTAEYAYRTRLRYTEKLLVNFAGSYTLAAWGCGTGCLAGAFVNARTGQVVWLPGSISEWHGQGERIVFKPDSRLLILAGSVNMEEEYGLHFYELVNGGFKKIYFLPQTNRGYEVSPY